jgi:hypothetical protein
MGVTVDHRTACEASNAGAIGADGDLKTSAGTSYHLFEKREVVRLDGQMT